MYRSVSVIISELIEIETDQKYVPQLLKDRELIRDSISRTP